MMRMFLLLLFVLITGIAFAAMPNEPAAPKTDNVAFDMVKSLAGDWEGTTSMGKVSISYKVVSNGTAVMESMDAGSENMLTAYYPDGKNLMMTHFCAAGNQPRMRSETSDGKQLNFTMVDATNLATPESGHMKQMVLTVADKDHISEAWTWTDKGEAKTDVFQLQRKK
jgi:hypothetical protein